MKENNVGGYKKQQQFDSRMREGHIELGKGAVTAVARVKAAIKKGVLFTNFLNMWQPTNSLQGAVVDIITGNYNYKLGIAKVKKLGESKYKSTFNSLSFVPRNLTA